MGEAVVLAGYLRKSPPEKKLTMSTWHKRYFVLRENKHLEYFKNEKEKKPLKEPIDLRHCKRVEAGLYHKSFKHVFSIQTSERLYYLVADSHEEMENWVERLCKACGFSKLDERNSPEFFIRKNKQSSSYGRSSPLPATSPVGSLSSSLSYLSSRMSSLSPASPTGYCPVHRLQDDKPRSSSDPPDLTDQGSIKVPTRRNMSLAPEVLQAQISRSSVLSECYDTVPTPRPVSQDVYDVVPPPREDPNSRNSGLDYDTVPPPRPDGRGSFLGDYDRLPSPRLPSRPASSLSSSESSGVYNIVPIRQNCEDSDDYDVPPLRQSQDASRMQLLSHQTGANAGSSGVISNHFRMMEKQETYDVLPPPRGVGSEQDTYDVLPSPRGVTHDQDTYDVVPPPRGIALEQDAYDSVPPPRASVSVQDNYDVVPPPRGIVSEQDTYDVLPSPRSFVLDGQTYDVVPLPRGIVSEQDPYDVVPPPRGVVSDQETYDVLPPPRGVISEEETYDMVPPPRGVVSDQETYDVLPPRRPPSQDLYDVVPPPRRNSNGACDTYDTLPRPVSTSEQCGSTLARALLKDPPQEIYDVVPPPKPSPYKGNVYDVVPSPTKNVSVDCSQQSSWGSLSNQCPLNSREGGYNQPLPCEPSEESRDSGVYGSGDIYQNPGPLTGPVEGHELQQNFGYQATTEHVPSVNRSTKPPPEVNRTSKPGNHKDHSYCNMPPPINRGTKPRQPTPDTNSYENYPNRNMHASLTRNQSLPVDALYQNSHINTSEPADESYCHMAPRRLETTRCYSFSKKPPASDENYEEMAAFHNVNRNSSSSSSSCYEDDEEMYTTMSAPAKPKTKKQKDLQYAEVQIVEGSPRARHIPQDHPSTQYTFISEESTQALRQACHARKEHLNN